MQLTLLIIRELFVTLNIGHWVGTAKVGHDYIYKNMLGIGSS